MNAGGVITGKAPGSLPCSKCARLVVSPAIAGKRVDVEAFPDPVAGTVVLSRAEDASLQGTVIRGAQLQAYRFGKVALYELHAINCAKGGKR